MELIAASHTKRTQRQFHKTRIKNIMAKQDLLLKDFLHGSNVDFIELQSDMRGIVIIILDLFTRIFLNCCIISCKFSLWSRRTSCNYH